MTAPSPKTSKIDVWRIDTDNRCTLIGIGDDPIAIAGAEQVPGN